MQMTFPMILTLLRIALIPVLILFFYLPYAWSSLAAATVFILAAITDWLDGYLARRMGLMSKLGAASSIGYFRPLPQLNNTTLSDGFRKPLASSFL